MHPLPQTYKHVSRRSPRGLVRHGVVSGLGAIQRARGWNRHLSRPRVHFLNFHHLFPDEEASFRKLIEALMRSHAFVSYSEAVERTKRGSIDHAYVCVSFDDGFATCRQAGRVLDEYGISACFFLITSMVGERNPHRIASFCRQQLNRPPLDFLDWSGVDDLLARGHEVGSHTVNHVDLGRATGDELSEELVGSRGTLERRAGRVDHLAWPYGRLQHFSAEAALSAQQAGYVSCASGERGAHVSATALAEPVLVRREHVRAAWPLSHNLYFIARSAQRAGAADNEWSFHSWEEHAGRSYHGRH